MFRVALNSQEGSIRPEAASWRHTGGAIHPFKPVKAISFLVWMHGYLVFGIVVSIPLLVVWMH